MALTLNNLKMDIQEDTIIGELVANDYRAASVFKKHGIDFCCNGNRTISDASSAKVSVAQLMDELNGITTKVSEDNVDYKSWPLDLLADYIEKKHHRYAEAKITEIKPYLNKIVKVHGQKHPELLKVEELFLASAGELTAHMKKEELMLFPFIRKMVSAKMNNEPVPTPMFGSVRNPIEMMMKEHTTEGERFVEIAELTYNYTPPADGCNTYKVTFALLQEFEEDLHKHIHLENNILFAKAIEMEKE